MKRLYTLLALAFMGFGGSVASAQCDATFSYGFYMNDSSTFLIVGKSGNFDHYWSFGDGTSYQGKQTAYHHYQKNGTYTLCHVVYDSARTCMDSSCMTITVNCSCLACSADFTYTVRGDSIDIQNTTSRSSRSYITFDMGDGNTYSTDSFTHIYKKTGQPTTYYVCLSYYDTITNCFDSTCKTIVINPRTNCQAAYKTIITKDTVEFVNASSPNTAGVSYFWVFGDGTTSTQKNPTHVYKAPNNYYACLIVTDSINNCTSQKCDTVHVDTVNTANCKADFGHQQYNLTIYFANRSQAAGSYYWDFGDGNTSTKFEPQHTYKNPGYYTVCLSIANSSGCSDSMCQTIFVDSIRCHPSFKVAIDTSVKYKVYLINQSSNLSGHTYLWTFGDSSKYSTKRNPSHHFNTFGYYEICLTVSDQNYRCSVTYCDSIGMDSTGKLLKADGFDVEVIEDFNSIGKLNVAQGSVYPNPTSGQLRLDLPDFKSTVAIQIFTMNGVEVYRADNFEHLSNILNVSDLPNGMYILTAEDGSNLTRLRFVKGE
ncbi:MAG: PKD domain-containing protein [Flavobacteriales bacterium]|nr:PKD domain-containing protein [Bacteroidota bacterium]MCB9240227.1 PKD domain-containing protein [Flavobacteriales bacterium]